jgi:hypothetical protein
MGNETGSKWGMPVEVMQALVALATEDANAARAEGDVEMSTGSASCEPRPCTTSSAT